MKKIFAFFAGILIVFSVAGCATLNVEGNGQTLAMPNQAWKEYRTYKSFYLLEGLIPVSNISTEDKLPSSGRVYIKKRRNVLDWLLSAVTFGIVYTETITVYSE